MSTAEQLESEMREEEEKEKRKKRTKRWRKMGEGRRCKLK
jgi:hypothetical protein